MKTKVFQPGGMCEIFECDPSSMSEADMIEKTMKLLLLVGFSWEPGNMSGEEFVPQKGNERCHAFRASRNYY